ncbi:MAG: lipopolysaccharide biosynthesis protein, partial [Gammaproteobacteria bacterium]|nr:lipopolysaccharide biosynthesis protein [Gammaproteobacteria bacterium]
MSMFGVAKGASWMVLFRLVERSLGLVSTLILARLLIPADFGLVAMAMSVVAFIELASAFSLDVPLIQHPAPTKDHYNTAWTLNVLFALGCGTGIALLAWPAADFYSDDRLGPVLLVLAAGWLVQGFENIGIVNFRRKMDFARETRFLLGKKLTGFSITLTCALLFRSYWALVAGVVAGRIMGVVLSYAMERFRPHFSLVARADLLSVSGWLFLNNLLYFGTTRVSHFIIGRVLGAQSLGLYTLGSELAYLPQTELVAPINRALFPGFSRMAEAPDELRRTFVAVNSVIALLVFPAAVGLATIANTLVPVLLGPNWAGAAPVLQILAVSGALAALTSNTYSAYLALGRARIVTWILVIEVIVLVSGMLILARPYGLVGVASAELIAITTGVTCSVFLLIRTLRVSVAEFALNLLRPAIAATGMG